MEPVEGLLLSLGVCVFLCFKWFGDDRAEELKEKKAADEKAKAEEEQKRRAKAQAEAEAKRRAEEQAKREAKSVQTARPQGVRFKTSIVSTFRHSYRVVGVTYDNEDGTSRQEILEAIAKSEPPYDECKVSIDEYDYEGELALAVNVNGDQIGNISRKEIDEVSHDLDYAEAVTLEIYGGANGKSYGAKVTLFSNGEE